MQEIIFKKSWAMHIFIIATRALLCILGRENFQLSYEASKANPNLNQEFIRATEPYLKPILYALIPLGAILDIAAWRRPHLARFICYFEVF